VLSLDFAAVSVKTTQCSAETRTRKGRHLYPSVNLSVAEKFRRKLVGFKAGDLKLFLFWSKFAKVSSSPLSRQAMKKWREASANGDG
jgi:hypothetical protein